ncbi:MAG: hypothetical protein NXH75_15755 [Halobacteriovoraceae bacterium]|nr:hypothetical protein [Halobacteriovoraceae bacterium]
MALIRSVSLAILFLFSHESFSQGEDYIPPSKKPKSFKNQTSGRRAMRGAGERKAPQKAPSSPPSKAKQKAGDKDTAPEEGNPANPQDSGKGDKDKTSSKTNSSQDNSTSSKPTSTKLPEGVATGTKKEIELPELTTKQNIKNIRYVSSDGKFTYYQRTNGSLQFSTNYEVQEVIKLEPHTQYRLIVSQDKKFILVEANQKYHTYFSQRSGKKLYVIKYGTNEINEIGMGTAIGLHFQDKWISYYDHQSRVLTIQNPLNESLKATVKLANNLNPYFTPQVVMTDTDTVLYTDLNKEGIPGLLKFNINAKKIKVIFKGQSINKTLDICLNKNMLFLTELGLDPIAKGTEVRLVDTKTLDLEKAKTIYTSEEKDLGSFVCTRSDEYLYFIKTTRDDTQKLTYDAYELDLKSKKVKRVSEVNFATTLFLMDKKLLLPYQDKYFIIKGSADLTKFDRLKKGPLAKPGG